ncbi:MAG: MBL fold metallo-hydrolase [candidate division WOR-3 bacterium]|nr:MAG: MBL fold metallo-hydrolase [candidate division WOR-3 bacterium]
MSEKRRWILWIGVAMALNVLDGQTLSEGGPPLNSITIIYNNIPGDTTVGLQVGGGFSAFIVFDQHNILFDAGGDATILLGNVRALELDSRNLNAMVISHNHWDHVYGSPGAFYLVETAPKVYVPASAGDAVLQQNPHFDLVPVDEPSEILPRVWLTGEMKTSYRDIAFYEQAMILDGDDGLYVITGCAHPGIVEIIERAREILPGRPIALVTGGFHLVNASEKDVREISMRLKELGVMAIAPSHCTGNQAMEIFREEWGERYLYLYLGHVHKF